MVLLGLSGLDMQDGNPMFFGPFHQLFTDVFRAIVDPYGARLAPPLDDPIKAPDHALSRCEADQKTIWEIVFPTIGKVHLDAQPFAVEVVQHV